VSTILVEVPESLRVVADVLARESGVTMQQLVATALAEKVSALGGPNWIGARKPPVTRDAYDEALSHIPSVEPEERDRL
jgi:hypothetical protein